ncbi:hypothetical protein [Chryseobacterium wanjuense]
MMKKLTLPMLVVMTAFSCYMHAQVGINTDKPLATLDVVGKPANVSSLDGMIPPRITGDQLRAKTYTSAQTGATIYVTAADSAPAGQTINVKTPGYYYFDGTVWNGMVITNLSYGSGNVLAIDGTPQIGQQVSARLDGDFTVPLNPTTITPIGRMTEVLVDNGHTFTGTATNNTFTVNSSGTYLVNMNFSLQTSSGEPLSGNCYYGIKNVTDNKWVAFNIETIPSLALGNVTNLSYTVAMELLAGKTYSFGISQQHSGPATTVLMRGTGISGGTYFPMTFFTWTRIR